MRFASCFTSRRQLLARTIGAVTLLVGRNASAQGVPGGIRKNVKSLTEAEWITLERGVATMKALAPDNPLSWTFQANMHGIPDGEPGPIYPGQGTCQHGNWWFLPWHRAYLLYFERILRHLCADPSFMLPYWDWTDPSQQALPARFLDPASQLYDSSRDININGGGEISSTSVSWPTVARQTTFSTSTWGQGIGGQAVASLGESGPHGAMELLCHDHVHDQIGGLMGLTATAARDPIFWLHHANVDRLWSKWLQVTNGSYLPDQPLWTNTPLAFYGPAGRLGYVMPAQLLNSMSLGYRYEDYPPMPATAFAMAPPHPQQQAIQPAKVWVPPLPVRTTIASQSPPRNELTAEPLSVTFRPEPAGRSRVEGALVPRSMAPGLGFGAPAPVAAVQSLQVVISDIKFSRSPGRYYEIYVNLPDPSEAEGPDSLYFGGSISFFALSSHGRGHAMGGDPAGKTATVDITEAAARLRGAGKLGDDIKITLIERSPSPKPGVFAAPAQAPPSKVTIGTISLQHSGS